MIERQDEWEKYVHEWKDVIHGHDPKDASSHDAPHDDQKTHI